ncbi:hypothetical protein [Streptomyces sp. NPDC093600]
MRSGRRPYPGGLLRAEVGADFGLYHLAAAERTSPDALAQGFASHL